MNEAADPLGFLVQHEPDLLAQLGRQVSGQLHGVDPKLLIAIAQAWLKDRWTSLRASVCGSATVRTTRSIVDVDEAVLVAAVADALSSVVQGPAAATAAVLLVRFGLDRLCLGD